MENLFVVGARWPCGVAVDGSHLCWGNAGKSSGSTDDPAIGRAALDGSNVEQAWVSGMQGICGVAIDPKEG